MRFDSWRRLIVSFCKLMSEQDEFRSILLSLGFDAILTRLCLRTSCSGAQVSCLPNKQLLTWRAPNNRILGTILPFRL